MRPDRVGPMITRLQMITAAAETDEDLEEIQDVLHAFDDAAAQRELVRRLAVDVAAKMPVGGHLAVRDAADFLALGLLQAVEFGLDGFRSFVGRLDERVLSDLAEALVVFWHEACLQTAAAVLQRVEIPETVPKEAP